MTAECTLPGTKAAGGGGAGRGAHKIKGDPMRKHRPLACAAAVVGALALAGPAVAAPPTNTQPLRDAVKVSGIREHLAALEKIANRNLFRGIPTRATGTPGHVASQQYV